MTISKFIFYSKKQNLQMDNSNSNKPSSPPVSALNLAYLTQTADNTSSSSSFSSTYKNFNRSTTATRRQPTASAWCYISSYIFRCVSLALACAIAMVDVWTPDVVCREDNQANNRVCQVTEWVGVGSVCQSFYDK